MRYLSAGVLILSLSHNLLALDAETVTPPTRDTPTNTGPTSTDRVLPGEPAKHKNYWLPILEIPTFQFALNQADRQIYPGHTYQSTWATGWDHVVHGPWTVDRDAFTVNQIGHPYQGTWYYNFARSSGLNFWESWGYANVGSFLWETYGETTSPSINDQVASGNAGALFGEALFRMSSLVLESGDEKPGFWRELGAGIIAPPAELNRLMFGDQYGPILEHRSPAVYAQMRAGGGWNDKVNDPGNPHKIARTVGGADFSIDYGLPGKPGYRYLRPLDYFHFDIGGIVENTSNFEDIRVRGMLFGVPYESGDDTRGIWGLYGSYDYASPQIFRYSMTGIGLGTNIQKWLSRSVALQGTGIAGVGYGSAGTIEPADNETDFHYGLAPQVLVGMRMIFGTRAMLDLTSRGYYITSVGASKAPGTEVIGNLDASFTVRVTGPHAVGLHYVLSSRDAEYQFLPDRHQSVGTLMVAYSYLFSSDFGAVHWGNHDEK